MKRAIAALVAATALATTVPAQARDWDHGHHGWYGGGHGHYYSHYHGWTPRIGLYFGVPLYWPRSYYYVDRYPATQVVIERQPQVYVQREAAPSPQASGYWYYCPDSRSYYPYTQSCPSPWMQVVPQTSPEGSP
jgi:hypothetical protein